MTTPSPETTAGSVVSLAITANGQPLDSSYQVVSVDVWDGVNRLPKARLLISDGDPAAADFPISDTPGLIPGKTLTIALGYDTQTTTVFSGVIYSQGLEVTQNGPSRLVVEATDNAMVMTLARKNAVFENQTDSQVIQSLISAAGLTPKVTSTSSVEPTIVQYYCSDWDLMVMRAQLNAMVVTVGAGTVTVAPPDTSTSPVLTLTYGKSLLDFRAAMDASTQYTASAIKSYAWDPATQAVTESGQPSTDVTTPGNLTSDQLAAVFGVSAYPQQTAGTLATADLTEWSSAELMKACLAKIRGEARFQGSTLVTPGCMVELAGLGDRFNGNGYVSGLHHRMVDGLWTTAIEIGLSPNWFAATASGIAAPGASGQLPPIANLQTGIVVQIADDPDGEFRVLVTLPLLQAGSAGVWARLGSFYASNGFGAEFYPEVNDEVVVAFMNGDPRFPVILGSLYSKKNPPPVPPAADNDQKSIVSREKLRLDFYEKDKAVEILTPGNQSIRLDDNAKTVTIKDMNGNTVTMASGGITLDSNANIALSAKGDITLEAKGNVSISATANASVEGLQVSATAKTTFSAQGQAEAKLGSSGMASVQAPLVKIN
jgi:Rhs element Vgr protein